MSRDAPLQSSLWYRVAPLRPMLLTRARLHRHRYRGERWYLLQDPASGRVHRFTPAARLVIAAMDGRRTVADLWGLARRRMGEDAPTQDDMIQLLGQLHASDLLRTDAAPDALEVIERGQRQEAAKRRSAWANPMAIRLPLVDPGRFLDRGQGLWRRLWGWPGALLWLLAVVPALLLLPGHAAELGSNMADRVLQADNLLLLLLVFPVVKALHELGHATATRARGGEVHDMGLMLLVMMPVPYVDASAASVLPSRWQRALIGAAGMIVELFLAALAFYVWLAVEPGLVRAVCFNVMVVAGVSTLVFNANPLLRYDGYYILSDLAEFPNLGQRAARYWGYLLQRHLLRVRDAVSPAHTRGERAWLGWYGLASAIYRVFVTLAIALFIGGQYFFAGVVLALWAVGAMVGLPLLRAIRHLQTHATLRERRGRIAAVAGAVLLGAAALATWLPLPQRAQAEGVVWLPEQAVLRTAVAGFVSRLAVAPGSTVHAGQTLVQRVDPVLSARIRGLEARVAELEASHSVEYVVDLARAQIVREQLLAAQAALGRAREQAAALPVVAAVGGVFVLSAPEDLPGRWHKQGSVLGHVLGSDEPVVRVVVEQSVADLVSASTGAVAVRLVDEPARVMGARITRQVPAANEEAPSRALVASGGGRLAVDPRDPEGRKTLERVFQIDLALTEPVGRPVAYGQRVHVRFVLEPAPLATQAWRASRRLFLRHFDV